MKFDEWQLIDDRSRIRRAWRWAAEDHYKDYRVVFEWIDPSRPSKVWTYRKHARRIYLFEIPDDEPTSETKLPLCWEWT